ncbi:MAG TPA: hypothetical protein VMZ00_06425 [Sporichthya sp.]|nr:hypothetical protein [Sporichthya sp.]
MRIDVVVVAREGADRVGDSLPRFRSSPMLSRVPLPPEHLYRPGKGKTLCQLLVDQSWERFPALDGQVSYSTCPACRDEFEAETAGG